MSSMAQNTASAIVSEIFRFFWAVLKMVWRLVKSPGRLVPDIDGMELNKIMAAVLLAGVIGMTSAFIAGLLVKPPYVEQFAYAPDMETGPADATAEEPEPELDIATLLQNADPSAGESFSRACASCHTFEQGGANRVGPNLWEVVGSDKGSVEGFNYSTALEEAESDWTYENLDGFLHRPREYLPGTSMSYAGIRDPEDRANVIAYLRTLAEEPEPLPEPPPAEEEAAAAEGEGGEAAGAGAGMAEGEGAVEGEGAAAGEGAEDGTAPPEAEPVEAEPAEAEADAATGEAPAEGDAGAQPDAAGGDAGAEATAEGGESP